MVKNILGLWFTNGIIKLWSESQADLLQYKYCEVMFSNLWSFTLETTCGNIFNYIHSYHYWLQLLSGMFLDHSV
jgi:hypothetical protein